MPQIHALPCDPLDPYCDDPLPKPLPLQSNFATGGTPMIGDTRSVFGQFDADTSYGTVATPPLVPGSIEQPLFADVLSASYDRPTPWVLYGVAALVALMLLKG